MADNTKHELELVRFYPTDAALLRCPDCDYCVVVSCRFQEHVVLNYGALLHKNTDPAEMYSGIPMLQAGYSSEEQNNNEMGVWREALDDIDFTRGGR